MVHAARFSHTPAQHAQFLQHAVSIDFTNPHPSASSDPAINTQTAVAAMQKFISSTAI